MNIKTLFINLLAFGTLLSSILTITAKNPVISVIFLISTFVSAAGYLILIGIQFLGLSYIVIYVGAIAVLFLFVIMMINIKLTDILETGSQYTKNLPIAIIIGSVFFFIIFTIVPLNLYNVPSLSISPSLFISATSTSASTPNEGLNLLQGVLNNLNHLFLDLNSYYNSIATDSNPSFINIIRDGLGWLEVREINNFANVTSVDYSSSVSNSTTAINDLFVLDFQQIEVLGHTLYTYASILFLLLSFILLLAMFATIVISN
jgi:NADH-ubiquinone oxidoreductase chain 6